MATYDPHRPRRRPVDSGAPTQVDALIDLTVAPAEAPADAPLARGSAGPPAMSRRPSSDTAVLTGAEPRVAREVPPAPAPAPADKRVAMAVAALALVGVGATAVVLWRRRRD